uniref:DNA-directed RNA polymerase n=1 Tax=Cajanus cajan TaxID=3821 RepID=A0A151TJS2_CAJCA|nr:DNA-directed RNA polymerase III subunit RPC1 [Cajanus cajan]
MDDDLFHKHKAPSGVIKAIKFDVLTKEDIEKISVLEIEAVGQVTCSSLGLPNQSDECATCGSKEKKMCEGHFGIIRFPFSILHPYFMSEIAQILNRICPVCKSIRHESKVRYLLLLPNTYMPSLTIYLLQLRFGFGPLLWQIIS